METVRFAGLGRLAPAGPGQSPGLEPWHGGRLQAAQAMFPQAPMPFLDLSTGINPHAYPFAPLDAACFARLPEPEHEAALRAVAAIRYRVPDAEYVVAAPGSQILISLLPRLLACRRVVILSPTYGEHAAAWSAAGAAVESVTDPDLLDDQVGPQIALVVCNPNNPDGRRLTGDRLRALAARCAARGGLLVVDEAFADLEPEVASATALLPSAGLLVLRSFGKSYGLAGLRLGFLLAGPTLAARVRCLLGPWAVGGAAIEIGRQALADPVWAREMTATLGLATDRLDRLLSQAGLEVLGGTRLFRLARAPDADAVFDRLGGWGILVRRFQDQPGWLRFGLPADEAAWTRLAAAFSVRR